MLDGILSVLEKFKVKKVIITRQINESDNYTNFKDIIKKKEIEVLEVNKGDLLKIDNDINIEILWPSDDNYLNENMLNNNSMVCKLNYINMSILFTGDIEEAAEKAMLEEYKNNPEILSSTVLKVAHHGSKSSSTNMFIEKELKNIGTF